MAASVSARGRRLTGISAYSTSYDNDYGNGWRVIDTKDLEPLSWSQHRCSPPPNPILNPGAFMAMRSPPWATRLSVVGHSGAAGHDIRFGDQLNDIDADTTSCDDNCGDGWREPTPGIWSM
ncbi:hypothetical protein GW17_00025822 [Ensete ventricosum]|nr:hypothetical protein GW17_00025822 [Ensete ventricosum]